MNDHVLRDFDRAVVAGDVSLARRLSGSVARLLEAPLVPQRIVRLRPAWDGRARTPGHGLHGADLIFAVRTEAAAASLIVFTGWGPFEHGDPSRHMYMSMHEPIAADVGVCVPDAAGGDCFALGVPCKTAARHSMLAEKYFETLITHGDEVLFAALEGLLRDSLAEPS